MWCVEVNVKKKKTFFSLSKRNTYRRMGICGKKIQCNCKLSWKIGKPRKKLCTIIHELFTWTDDNVDTRWPIHLSFVFRSWNICLFFRFRLYHSPESWLFTFICQYYTFFFFFSWINIIWSEIAHWPPLNNLCVHEILIGGILDDTLPWKWSDHLYVLFFFFFFSSLSELKLLVCHTQTHSLTHSLSLS